MSIHPFTRRKAFAGVSALVGGTSRAERQDEPGARQARLIPLGELVNLLEFEGMARRALDAADYAAVAGSDRDAFDRMSLRPRMLVKSSALDLTTELSGERMFAPILVAPTPEQRRFHPDAELAMVQGASEAKTTVVLSSQSSYPIERIATQAQTTLWYHAYASSESEAVVRSRIQQALSAGCKAVCITPPRSGSGQLNWRMVDILKTGIDVPVLLRGIMAPDDALEATERGMAGVMISNNNSEVNESGPAPIEVLTSVVDAVEGRIPVLIEGSFRRGTDVIKALALGARAVLLGRPPMWGLAAYGADGVRAVLTMLQAELARTMINVGKPTLDALDRDLVRIHSRASH